MSLFLTPEEIEDLTGIKRGRDGKSRGQLQCDHLRKQGIPFFPNAAGEPKVARAFIEGRDKTTQEPKSRWKSNVLTH